MYKKLIILVITSLSLSSSLFAQIAKVESTTKAGDEPLESTFFWDPASSVYRSGLLSSLDLAFVGNESWAHGHLLKATGVGSFSWGSNNAAQGIRSTTWGENNSAFGNNSTVWGDSNRASQRMSTIWGGLNKGFGELNTLWGLSNESDSTAVTVWGIFNKARGQSSTVWGQQNSSCSAYSTVWGLDNHANNSGSTAWGNKNFAGGNYATVIGENNSSSFRTAFVIGQYNYQDPNPFGGVNGGLMVPDCTVIESPASSKDRIFEIGVGNSPTQRANALTVLRNGKIGIGVSDPQVELELKGGYTIKMGQVELLGLGSSARLFFKGNLVPNGTALYNLGEPGNRWLNVYTQNIIQTSDSRLKNQIKDSPYGLVAVMALRPVSYHFVNETKRQLGFIAQEVQKIIPEIVDKTTNEEESYLGVKYTEIIPVLTKAIQDQQALIEALQERITQLEQNLVLKSVP